MEQAFNSNLSNQQQGKGTGKARAKGK